MDVGGLKMNDRIAKLLENFQRLMYARGANAKTVILNELKGDEDFTQTLKFLLDPYKKTNIGMKKLAKTAAIVSPLEVYTPEAIVMYMERLDGTDASCLTVHRIAEYISVYYNTFGTDFIYGLATKTLKVGVTAKTANKVYGKHFIPLVGVMLANKYGERKDKVNSAFIVTEKLDGIRRIIQHNIMGEVKAYSRSGIEDVNIKDILEQIKKLPAGFAYDGELVASGTFKDCIEQRQATNSLCATDGTTTGVSFHIFDIIPLTDYLSDTCTTKAKIRKTWLAYLTGDYSSIETMWPVTDIMTILEACKERFGSTPLLDYTLVKSVPIMGLAYDEAEILKYATDIWDKGFEGVMLNTFDGLYEVKRSDAILKVKNVLSLDLRIVGWLKGDKGKKYENVCGALLVSYKGNEVGVGSGLSDTLRADIAANFEKYRGRIVEINTFGESRNASGAASLNAPIFVGLRDDKEEADA